MDFSYAFSFLITIVTTEPSLKSMPGTLLSTLHILAHLILLRAYEIENYHYPHFTEKKVKEELGILIVGIRAKI